MVGSGGTARTVDADGLDFPTYGYGRELPVLPLVKLARAREHQAALYSQIASWQSARPVVASLELDPADQSVVVGRLHIEQPPPALQWSVVFGDAVHNCRSALDAAVWAFATMEGAVPSRPKLVQFPIYSDEAEFKAFCLRALSTVPSPVLARLALLQPFAIADDKTLSGLSLLQDFSNLDKHRALILPRPVALALTISAQLRYAEEASAERFGERPMHVEPDFSAGLVEGSEVLRMHANAQLLEASGNMEVQVEPHTQLGTGPVVHLRLALEAVLRAADDALRVIAGGLVKAEDPRADRSWQPLHLEPLQGPALDDWKIVSPEGPPASPEGSS